MCVIDWHDSSPIICSAPEHGMLVTPFYFNETVLVVEVIKDQQIVFHRYPYMDKEVNYGNP